VLNPTQAANNSQVLLSFCFIPRYREAVVMGVPTQTPATLDQSYSTGRLSKTYDGAEKFNGTGYHIAIREHSHDATTACQAEMPTPRRLM
jgi:hypothetical protein